MHFPANTNHYEEGKKQNISLCYLIHSASQHPAFARYAIARRCVVRDITASSFASKFRGDVFAQNLMHTRI